MTKAIEAAKAAYDAKPFVMMRRRKPFPDHDEQDWQAMPWDALADWMKEGMTGFLTAYLAAIRAEGFVMVPVDRLKVLVEFVGGLPATLPSEDAQDAFDDVRAVVWKWEANAVYHLAMQNYNRRRNEILASIQLGRRSASMSGIEHFPPWSEADDETRHPWFTEARAMIAASTRHDEGGE